MLVLPFHNRRWIDVFIYLRYLNIKQGIYNYFLVNPAMPEEGKKNANEMQANVANSRTHTHTQKSPKSFFFFFLLASLRRAFTFGVRSNWYKNGD